MSAAQLKRLGRIVGVYVLFGPPLGAAITFAIIMTYSAVQNAFERAGRWLTLFPASEFWTGLLDYLSHMFAAIWFMMGFGFIGYVVGAIPALLVGLIVGFRQSLFDRGSWKEGAAAGALVGVPYSFFLGWPFTQVSFSIGSVGFSMVVCALTSVLCWLLVDKFSSSYWQPIHDHHA